MAFVCRRIADCRTASPTTNAASIVSRIQMAIPTGCPTGQIELGRRAALRARDLDQSQAVFIPEHGARASIGKNTMVVQAMRAGDERSFCRDAPRAQSGERVAVVIDIDDLAQVGAAEIDVGTRCGFGLGAWKRLAWIAAATGANRSRP
jgi:hypothetical protein